MKDVLLDLLRGVGLWVLVLAGIALIGYVAYVLGLVYGPDHRDRMALVFCGFAGAGLVTLIVFIVLINRIAV